MAMLTPTPFTAGLEPVVVLSPVQRCGTTLVQRLLCSAPDTLVYGDEIGREMAFFLNAYSVRQLTYRGFEAGWGAQLDEVLAGRTDCFLTGLLPEIGGLVEALGDASFGWLRYCQEFAEKNGRPRWGWKFAGAAPQYLSLLRALMPRSRVIVVTRALRPCVASAKAAGMLGSPAEVEGFARAWKEGGAAFGAAIARGEAHGVRLEDLADGGEATVEALENFAGTGRIDRGVLQVRTNTVGEGTTRPGYIAPADLTEEESAIVAQYEKG